MKKQNKITKPKTISELKRKDIKLYELFLRERYKFGVTFKQFVEYYF